MTDRRSVFHDIVNHKPTDVPYLVGAWQHLVGHEYGAEEFASAYVDFVRRWDWDWVKINPRAVYYAEAWGSKYDKDDYAGFVLPKRVSSAIETPADVAGIKELDPERNEYFAEAIAAAALIRQGLEDRAVLETIFSPLSVLLQIADLPLYPGDDYATGTLTVKELIDDQPEVAKLALANIAHTLAAYAKALVRPASEGGAGLDGVFYAVTGTVSEDYFDAARYQEFSAPYDRIVIDAVKRANPQAVVLLHTCRAASHPNWFDVPGVDVLQWDQFLPGNPKADAHYAAVPVAGANFELFAPGGDVDKLRDELKETIALREGKPFLLAPSCTVPTPATDEALEALAATRVTR
ncbi:uroporphyrinogen decarboxylase family protein [Bifidobacterium aesculapii]|uniref:uroporphyrinogen decarboxylase family protein n=1 Tax=Bifidobacterium aesculapii TaxID=1329411 RepID=UPI0006E4188A|nr:uroporphyrinogen decarboxylase family protein [Bifidobacterium aesculapii]